MHAADEAEARWVDAAVNAQQTVTAAHRSCRRETTSRACRSTWSARPRLAARGCFLDIGYLPAGA